MFEFLGHLHPLLVHLPIGILLLACLFLWQSRKDRYANLQPSINVILLLGMISAIAACITGFILAQTGDYDESMVSLHQWMGISVAAVSVMTYFLYKRKSLRKWQLPLAFLLVLLIFVTGHLGGSLTHGSDYLTQPLADFLNGDTIVVFKRKPIADMPEANVYANLVMPAFQEKCYLCHGKNKQKGRLRLDDSAFIMKGGKDGVIIKPGNSAQSELIKRIMLPPEDDHHMPPKEKPQLSDNEITLLKWWIDGGASFSTKVKDLAQSVKIKSALLAIQNSTQERKPDPDLPQQPVDKADETAVHQLRDSGVVVIPVAQNSNYLSANFVTSSINDNNLSALVKVKKQLIWLALNNKPVNDSDIRVISQCTALVKLELARTTITDKGLAYLKDLPQLRLLNLVGDHITTSGLMQLKDVKSLRLLYLFETNIAKDDWAAVKSAFPKTSIDSGGYNVPLLPDDTVIVKPPPIKN